MSAGGEMMLLFLPQLMAAVAIPVTEDDVEHNAVDASETFFRIDEDEINH